MATFAFSVLVFMAIVTTLMANPMFNRFYRKSDGTRHEAARRAADGKDQGASAKAHAALVFLLP